MTVNDGNGIYGATTNDPLVAPKGIKGIVVATEISAGTAGEDLSTSTITATPSVSATVFNMASVQLTEGVWMVEMMANWAYTGAAPVGFLDCAGGISLVSATIDDIKYLHNVVTNGLTIGANSYILTNPLRRRVVVTSGTTTVYAVSRATYTTLNSLAIIGGRIQATRIA